MRAKRGVDVNRASAIRTCAPVVRRQLESNSVTYGMYTHTQSYTPVRLYVHIYAYVYILGIARNCYQTRCRKSTYQRNDNGDGSRAAAVVIHVQMYKPTKFTQSRIFAER